MSFTAPAWFKGSFCRRDTNATSRRTALGRFLLKQSWPNTSRLTRRSWRSAWYAPMTHPGWVSIFSLPFDLIFDSIKENDMWQEVPQQKRVQRALGGACHRFQGQDRLWVRCALLWQLAFHTHSQDSICPPVQQNGFATWCLWKGVQGYDG